MSLTIVLVAALAGAAAGWPLAWLTGRLAGVACPAWPVILASATACALGGATAHDPVAALVSGALALVLVLLAAVDLLDWRLPDVATLPLLLAGLLQGWLSADPLLDRLLGAVVGYAALAVVSWGFHKVSGRSGLGLGDAKLFAAAGAWLGWSELPQVLLVACGLGFAWAGLRVVFAGRASLRRPIPFGPPLCAALFGIWAWLQQTGT